MTLMEEVTQAYAHLHDLDWLQESQLTNLPEARRKVQPQQFMPEAQALRGLLMEAASRVFQDIEKVPGMKGVRVFIERYAQGKRVSEIPQELGVSREWCSRSYKKEAFRLAGIQFVRSISSALRGRSSAEMTTAFPSEFRVVV